METKPTQTQDRMTVARISPSARASLIALTALFTAMVGESVAYAGTSGVVGCWKTVSDKDGKLDSIVCLEEKNGELRGEITKLFDESDPNPTCDRCKGKLKDRPILGMTILWGMKKDKDVWRGGKILDPENGETYSCVIWSEGNKLKVRGYLGIFYRTQTWIK